MKALSIILAAILLSVFLLYLLLKGNLTFLNNLKSEFIINKSIPSFEFFQLDSVKYTHNDLPRNTSLFIIHFNSTCEHCQVFARQLSIYANDFSKSQLLLISEENLYTLKKFEIEYNLNQLKFVKMLNSNHIKFYESFNSNTIPAIFIFNKRKQLVKKFEGEVKIEALLKYVNG